MSQPGQTSPPRVEFPLVSVDVGNTRTKLGVWAQPLPPLGSCDTVPQPQQPLSLDPGRWDLLAQWCQRLSSPCC